MLLRYIILGKKRVVKKKNDFILIYHKFNRFKSNLSRKSYTIKAICQEKVIWRTHRCQTADTYLAINIFRVAVKSPAVSV